MFAGANSKCIGEESSTTTIIRAIFLLEVMAIGILLSAFSTFTTLQYYFNMEEGNKKGSGILRRGSFCCFYFFDQIGSGHSFF